MSTPPSPSVRTLAEVAREAGVSRMTVSRVLRHPERVAEATRLRVLEVIDRLAYRPNPLISTLMASTRKRRVAESDAGISFMVSLAVKEMENYDVGRRIYEGAKARAEAKGYEVILHSLSEEKIPAERFGPILRARGIEGVIFGPLDTKHTHLPYDLTGFAAVSCGFALIKPMVHRVATNQWELASGAYLMAEERGYQRIGTVIQSGYMKGIAQHWSSAFLFHQQKSGNRLPILFHQVGDISAFRKWLRRWKPDCVISSAPEPYEWLRSMGARIPEDLGFLLLGNFPGAEHLSGWLKNYEAIGAAAADMIALQLHDNERALPNYRKVMLIDPLWNEGTTIAKGKAVSP